MNLKPSRLQTILLTALTAVCVVLIGFVVVRNNGPTPHTEVVTHTELNPSESPIPASYSVPDNRPQSIEISSQSIKGNIQNVGIDQYNAIAAPNNVHLAGWFVNSVLPGRKGLSIIDGHVDGISQRGIFHNLSKVKTGDEVVVTYGSNAKHTYVVFKTQTASTEQANKYLFAQDPDVVSQLNIITCTGTYQRDTRQYDKRVIVSAKLVN